MTSEALPRLRTVEKYKPPFPLNEFPKHFAVNLGKEIVYVLATRSDSRLEGTDWEAIFARLIGAKWKPSNNGLDDVLLQQTAWGAKTVKCSNPQTAKKVRLISGRNSPFFSFKDSSIRPGISPPERAADRVLSIWNERVSGIKKNYQHLRTVVLLKSNDLTCVALFEFNTVSYNPKDFRWSWNENNNLKGHDRDGMHKFTWQSHGSQFTIVEPVPESRLCIRVKKPKLLDPNVVVGELGFDSSWVEILT